MISDLHDNIRKYYEECEFQYRQYWRLAQNKAVHYGYWDETTKKFSQALINTNYILSKKGQIQSSDVVLDAGCGVGGSSIYLAQTYGCKVTGINIVQRQLDLANDFAKKEKVDHLVAFKNCDYTNTDFADESFDVIWAEESVCHALEKRRFMEEACRLLKKGGRLIMSDFFKKKDLKHPKDKYYIDMWAYGWAVPDFETIEQFEADLIDVGFKDIAIEERSENIFRTAQYLGRICYFGFLLEKLHLMVHKPHHSRMDNILAGICQYKALKAKLWSYNLIYAKKP